MEPCATISNPPNIIANILNISYNNAKTNNLIKVNTTTNEPHVTIQELAYVPNLIC